MVCKKCGKEFPITLFIEGKRRNLSKRSYCLICSPFGQHNTRKICGSKDKRGSVIFDEFDSNPSSKEMLEFVVSKGYRVDKDGRVFKGDSPLKLQINTKGYYKFNCSVRINGKKKNRPVKVHRLQGFTKFGAYIFTSGIQVRHLNGNKQDNSWENIEIGTQSQNRLDIPKEERSSTLKNLGVEVILKIKNDYTNKEGGYKKLGKKYSLHPMTIRDIVKERLCWTKEIS